MVSVTQQGVRRPGGRRPQPVARLLGAAAAVAVMMIVGVGAYVGLPKLQGADQPEAAAPSFPNIDRSSLTPLQSRVVNILETQWHAQPASATFTEVPTNRGAPTSSAG